MPDLVGCAREMKMIRSPGTGQEPPIPMNCIVTCQAYNYHSCRETKPYPTHKADGLNDLRCT